MRASMSRLLSDRVTGAARAGALAGSTAASATSSFHADDATRLRNRPVAFARLLVGFVERFLAAFFVGTMARS
jgi:hypothetical protein